MSAIISEELQLGWLKCDTKDLDQWYEISCHGSYGTAYRFALRGFGRTEISQLAADIALNGPIDIACSVGVCDVNDVHPAQRLRKMRGFASENYMRGDVSWRSMQDEVFPAARLFGVGEIAVARSLLGKDFWSPDFIGNCADNARRRGEDRADVLRFLECVDKLPAASLSLFTVFMKERASGRRPSRSEGGALARAPMTLYRNSCGINLACLEGAGLAELDCDDAAVFSFCGLFASWISKSILLGVNIEAASIDNVKRVSPNICNLMYTIHLEETLQLHCPCL